METKTIQVDGLAIRYADSGGPGPVIVATSPWPESLLAFRRVWPTLAGGQRLIALDLPGFGHSEGRADLFTPSAMAEFLRRFIDQLELGAPHLVAPDVGTGASLFLAARHPELVGRIITGAGAASYPLEVGGVLAGIIAAPGPEAFAGQDIRATIGATVEPVAPQATEPEVWEDYVTGYENGRFAESTRYVRSYPDELPVLRDLLALIKAPVHVVTGSDDPLVPPSNGRFLTDRIPGSKLTVLDTGHFPWELVPDQYAAIVRNWVAA